jgi:hypothetical protein
LKLVARAVAGAPIMATASSQTARTLNDWPSLVVTVEVIVQPLRTASKYLEPGWQ